MGCRFVARSTIEAPVERLAAWHFSPGAFERLSPPWERPEIIVRPDRLVDGARMEFAVPAGPFRMRWVAVHGGFIPGRQFRDEQLEGPFKRWVHTHRFDPQSDQASTLEDSIEFTLPFGRLGSLLGLSWTRSKLRRLMTYRHAITRADLARHGERAGQAPLKVAVSGSGGLVGSALVALLRSGGHEVFRLVRRRPADAQDAIYYDPQAGEIDGAKLEGLDAVVHLAGESIAGGRWTASKKRAIRDSRVHGTELIARTIGALRQPPSVLVNASAIGYYGDRGEEIVDEDSQPGRGFLAETCVGWETACEPAEQAGVRVVRTRIGIVLSGGGGALSPMLPAFRAGVGGPIGHGRQFMSWIALDDLIGILYRALWDDSMRGPINAVAPSAVRNREFARTLGRVLSRPSVLPLPAVLLKLGLGEMAEELLLAGARVEPRRLKEIGFRFRFPDLASALCFELGRFGKAEGLQTPVFEEG